MCRLPQVLDYFDLPHIWSADITADTDDLPLTLEKSMKKHYSDFWKHRLNLARTTGGKLEFYASFKSDLAIESYLSLPFPHRKSLCKFRICNHKLEIETGRYAKPKIDRQLRFCKHCTGGVVEDEIHFIFDCPYYRFERSELSSALRDLVGVDINSSVPFKSDLLSNLLKSNDKTVQIAMSKFMKLACERSSSIIHGWATQTLNPMPTLNTLNPVDIPSE